MKSVSIGTLSRSVNRAAAFSSARSYSSAKEWLSGGGFGAISDLKAEYTHGDSRFDFYMERDGERYLTEVKGCTLATDLERGIGLFPDAPTERGVKHLNELATAAMKGYHCTIAFVIQMNGIHMVFPNNDTHPEFGKALIHAANAGVQVVYYGCHVEADSIKINGKYEANLSLT